MTKTPLLIASCLSVATLVFSQGCAGQFESAEPATTQALASPGPSPSPTDDPGSGSGSGSGSGLPACDGPQQIGNGDDTPCTCTTSNGQGSDGGGIGWFCCNSDSGPEACSYAPNYCCAG